MSQTDATRAGQIARIEALPALLEDAVGGLSVEQLLAHPLADEWSVAQNVHHLADSHMNAYVRCKLILTEERPTLKPYFQNAWAETVDGAQADVSASLAILRGLHNRWVTLLRALPADAWSRAGWHPELQREYTIDSILTLYSGHGEAHLDQIARTLAAQAG